MTIETIQTLSIQPARRPWLRRLILVSCGIALLATPVTAPAKNSLGCRAGIARSMRRIAGTGMRMLDECHVQLNRGADMSCAALPPGLTDWSRQSFRTRDVVHFKCADDEPVRGNYQPCVECALTGSAQTMLEANAAELFADTALSGGAALCQEAIAKARARIARSTLRRAQACQRSHDRQNGAQFVAIDDACIPASGRHGKERDRLERACRGLASTDVKTCDPLPDCVLEAAESLGRDLAIATYGSPVPPVVCGDGDIGAGEECDDSNTVATDACTDTCQNARCGDGITWEGVEECDDGNTIATDDCDDCHLPVCGDGTKAGSEECDDGNDVPGDGCTNCQYDTVSCGAGGMRATVTYADPQATNAAAGVMLIGYPAAVSIPGSGPAGTVRQRVTNLSGAPSPVFLVSNVDTNTDGVEDSLRVVFGTSSAWPAGPFAEVRFDCASGVALRAPDFRCTFVDASDAFSNAIDPTLLVCSVTQLQPIP